MRVVEIRSEACIAGLEARLGRALLESAADTIFLTWEWVSAWWSAYGKPGELRIFVAFDDHDVLRGIAPVALPNYAGVTV